MLCFIACLWCLSGGLDHICHLRALARLGFDGFWDAFEELPEEITALDDALVYDEGTGLQLKLRYLRERLEEAAGPLL